MIRLDYFMFVSIICILLLLIYIVCYLFHHNEHLYRKPVTKKIIITSKYNYLRFVFFFAIIITTCYLCNYICNDLSGQGPKLYEYVEFLQPQMGRGHLMGPLIIIPFIISVGIYIIPIGAIISIALFLCLLLFSRELELDT